MRRSHRRPASRRDYPVWNPQVPCFGPVSWLAFILHCFLPGSHELPVDSNSVVRPTVAGAAPELVDCITYKNTAPDFPFHFLTKRLGST